jgi:hypothetical protein
MRQSSYLCPPTERSAARYRRNPDALHGVQGSGFDGADDFDLELLEARTFDGHTQVLTYRPTRHS